MRKDSHDSLTNTVKECRCGLFDFVSRRIASLRQLGRVRSSETLYHTLRSFMQFRAGRDVTLQAFDSALVERYEAFLKTRGLTRNSTSFYMRNLRSAYRTAVDEGLTADNHPFSRVYTGVDKTVKRAITIDDVRRIKSLDLTSDSTLEVARDILMFSFYMRGMSFIDMAYLRKSDIHGCFLTYLRKKTSHQLNIEIPREAMGIIAKYRSPTKYLLPLITSENGNERNQYKTQLTIINRRLKKIGERVGLPIPLSTYVMRHAWATIARDKGIELSVISHALGHGNEATTQIYLNSISAAKVDRANRLILDDL